MHLWLKNNNILKNWICALIKLTKERKKSTRAQTTVSSSFCKLKKWSKQIKDNSNSILPRIKIRFNYIIIIAIIEMLIENDG